MPWATWPKCATATQKASWAAAQELLVGYSFARATTRAGDAPMNRHIKKWLIGMVVGTTGTLLVWSGYRATGLFLLWIGWGIAAYGIGGGLLERIRQSRKK